MMIYYAVSASYAVLVKHCDAL